MADERPTARFNLPSADFPFVIEARLASSGVVVWRRVIAGPKQIDIPPLARLHGGRVVVRIIWPDGRVAEG